MVIVVQTSKLMFKMEVGEACLVCAQVSLEAPQKGWLTLPGMQGEKLNTWTV